MGLIKHKQLVRSVLEAIELSNAAFCWKMQSGLFRTWSGKPAGQIGRRGVPDICGITKRGYFLGIEVKVGRDQQSKSQSEFQYRCETSNAYYFIFNDKHDIDVLIQQLFRI